MEIYDKTFGKMKYEYSWSKKDSFSFLGKDYTINITAQAYNGDEILESQRENYINYKKYLKEHEVEIIQQLTEYCKVICNTNDIDLENCITPKSIIFERDNSWGILFESDCDVENGVALFIINKKIEVGPQDEFL